MGRVVVFGFVVRIRAKRNSPQQLRNVIIAAETRPPEARGKKILLKIVNRVHPSTLADSSNSEGIFKNVA